MKEENSMRKAILVSAAIVLMVVAFSAWRLHEIKQAPPPPVIGIVWDASGSDDVGCNAVDSLAMTVFALPDIRHGSQLALITTGDRTNNHAGRLAGEFEVPVSTQVMEGRIAESRRRREFGDAVLRACEKAPRPTRSPILAAVKSGLEHLRANGCGNASGCALFVATDGAENVDPSLHAAIRGSKSALAKLRGTVGNEGIKVSFCGFAQTRGSSPGDHLQQAWADLFSAPELVTFAPYCHT